MPQPPEFAEVIAPCPFCGDVMVNPTVSEGSTFRWRKVDGCCADGPEVRHNTMADDQTAAEIESHAKAITAWNTRTPPTPAGYDAGDVSTASAEGFRAGVASVGEWLPIDSAPKDRLHIRGLWVREIREGMPDRMDWRAFVGYVNDSGRFVDSDYSEDFGWEADDYEKWHPMPAPPAIAQPSEVGGA